MDLNPGVLKQECYPPSSEGEPSVLDGVIVASVAGGTWLWHLRRGRRALDDHADPRLRIAPGSYHEGMVKTGVLALQGDFREHVRVLSSMGATAIEVRTPAQLADVDRLVIPGGESTTMGKLARAYDLVEPIRERAETACRSSARARDDRLG